MVVNEKSIKEYEQVITDTENYISKVEQNTVLDRQQKYKLIERLDSVINHCKGKIQVLNGSFVPNQNNYRKGQ